jgi:hypothetical protein
LFVPTKISVPAEPTVTSTKSKSSQITTITATIAEPSMSVL